MWQDYIMAHHDVTQWLVRLISNYDELCIIIDNDLAILQIVGEMSMHFAPRRVVAISATVRVSQEIGVKLGHEDLLDEPDFASYNLTVNEAHKNVLIDILFRLVKDITRFGKDIRLLISRATLDAEKFSDFFMLFYFSKFLGDGPC
ncbi:hypothetical protein V6N12_064770 [Hibiscus sabdariffa]|uniref:Uncharacterized protein n=1 Tax=Hibiscus sabdariffa TaxID=183260 RepID=A0ABR2G6X2_9ROSI